MDGSALITQCLIAPGKAFSYHFVVEQIGTFWLHGHYDGQYIDGFRSPLILHGYNEMQQFEYDSEYVVPLADWYHREHADLMTYFMSKSNPDGIEPIPDSPLIDNTWKGSVYYFQPGKRYRLRFVCMSAMALFNVWIDDHEMLVIEIDGVAIEPYLVKSLPIAAGQRYSVIVNAKLSNRLNYKLHANFDSGMFNSIPPQTDSYASIIYSPEANLYHSDSKNPSSSFDDLKFEPLHRQSTENIDIAFTLNANLGVDKFGINRGSFNNIPFSFPQTPTLLKASASYNPMELNQYEPWNTNAKIIKFNQNVQVILNNFDSGSHPFHLHGHIFQVLERGSGEFKGDGSSLRKSNPLRRDTVVVPAKGYVVLNFRADNPGIWFFHCHIEWHMQSGLSMIFIASPDILQRSQLEIPGLDDYRSKTCPMFHAASIAHHYGVFKLVFVIYLLF
jgi:iron transport multicopper oxidase